MWQATCDHCDYTAEGETYLTVEKVADRHELETGHRRVNVFHTEPAA